jgi:hypothetical protein
MAVQVEGLEPEVGAKRLELVDEAVGTPQRRVVGPIRLATAELVVEDDASIGPCQPLERLQVEAAAARTAVQQDERPIALAEDPVADGPALDLDLSGAAREDRPGALRPLRGRTSPRPRSEASTSACR